MKKIFYFIASAIVALGAVACQNDVDETINPESKGVSFYAEVEGLSRITIGVQNENGYPVIWEVGDKLEVNTNEKIYFFEYDGEKFTCYDEGVENIVGKNVLILYTSSIYGLDSTLGKSGLYLSTGHEIVFSPDMTIKLEVEGSFLRFASEHSVTLSMESEEANENPFIYDNGYHNSITLEAGDDIWVPFYINTPTPPHCEYTLSASIDGEVIKSTTVELEKGKIYNLGTIVKPSKVYLAPGVWASDGAKFAAYFFNDDAQTASLMATRAATEVWVWMTDEDNDGTYECNVPEGFAKVIFCRMNPAAETPSFDSAWNKTADLDIDTKAEDYTTKNQYYVTGYGEESQPSNGSWNVSREEEVTTPATESTWAIAGGFSDWGDTAMTTTSTNKVYVAQGIELAAGAEFKVKVLGDTEWKTSYGGGIKFLKANNYMQSYFDGSNISVEAAGTYDIYFDEILCLVYLMETGTAYTTATIQGEDGTDPAGSGSGDVIVTNIGLVGSFQGWNVAAPIAMTDNGDGWLVASNVELYKGDEFKFVVGNSWDGSYGHKDAVLVAETDTEYTLSTDNGQNIKATKNGKFNVYFNAASKAFKYTVAEEYSDLMVNITIDNKANWSPLYITLKSGDTTIVENATVTDNKYAISGNYIGESLSYVLSNGTKTSDGNVSITKDGATINLEEVVIKLKVQLDTNNAKQWWGTTMKIHVWETGTSFDTSWPGVAMTSEGNYTWSINVPSELVGKTINYLVHNGNGWQSSDAKVTINAEGNTVTGSSIGIN